VDEVFKNIIQALNSGDKIELRGFGSFRVRKRDARRGRNPKTGEPVDIPAKTVPYFKPGKELKELINGKPVGDEPDDDLDDEDDFDDAPDAQSNGASGDGGSEIG
ncbi:MAG: HU family DNA-binding protein, partial [Acidobacteria bacterium]|nr:HU family DNA-binding protein [Acidobacteriota bacterium]